MPSERVNDEQAVALVISELEDVLFNQAWPEGCAVRVERAIVY